jgi:hypothetical protein
VFLVMTSACPITAAGFRDSLSVDTADQSSTSPFQGDAVPSGDE